MSAKVNGAGLTFAEWLRLADAEVEQWCGLSMNDLPDVPPASYDAWMDETPPEEHARERLEEEGFPFE
jgi:hypothetical protein